MIKKVKIRLEVKVKAKVGYPETENISEIIIGSGAAGDVINYNNLDLVNIIGEVKHHEWVKASENGTKIIEISHFSEKIFKNMVEILLEKNGEVEVILSEEKNGYKIY